MNKLTHTEDKQVENKLEELDHKVNVVIIKSSDSYTTAHLKSAVIASILITGLLYLLPITVYDFIWYIWAQILGLVLGYLLCFKGFIKQLFISRSEKKISTELKFYQLIHNTQTQSLLFISLFEKEIKFHNRDKMFSEEGLESELNDLVNKCSENKLFEGVDTFLENLKNI